MYLLLVAAVVLPGLHGCAGVGGADDHGNTRDTATAIAAPGTPVSGELESAADVDYFKVAVAADSVQVVAAVEVATAATPQVTLEDVAGEGSARGAAASGSLPTPRPDYVYIRVTGEASSYALVVWLVAAAPPEGDGFDIELQYLGTEPSAAQKGALAAAARYWEGVITSGLPDLPVPTAQWRCRANDPSLFGRYLDDLLIYVQVAALDGGAAAAAESTICARRAEQDGGLPFLGEISFDPRELENLERHGYLERMAMRQIAYVLGFGLLWDEAQFGLLQQPSVAADGGELADQDTHFTGAAARRAFAAVGGAAYAGAAVPVENDVAAYGSGALDLHWRESVFGAELMTTLLETAQPPVSLVTIASLADLGYEVDATRAESYELPASGTAPGRQPAGGAVFGGRGVLRTAHTAAALPAGLVQGGGNW